MQHFLYFKPLPQGHGSLRPIFDSLFLKKSIRLLVSLTTLLCNTSRCLLQINKYFPSPGGRVLRGGGGTSGSRLLSLSEPLLQINAQKRFSAEFNC
jgi:hypothetical protein